MDSIESLKHKNGLKRRKQPQQQDVDDAPSHVAMPIRQRSSWPRIFKPQLSLNDELTVSDKSFQIIRDIAMVYTVLFIAYILTRDLYIRGKDVSWLTSSLGTPEVMVKALSIELCLLGLALTVQPSLQIWRYMRDIVPSLRRVFDVSFILVFAGYVFGTAALVCYVSYQTPFPTYFSGVLTIEQLRLSMKTYSYVRENAYKVIYPWNKEDQSGPAVWYKGQMEPKVGSYSQFLYFLFAPTMIYRDNYPRNPGPINWKNVAVYLAQFVLSLWCVAIICSEFIFPKSLKSEVLLLSYMASLVYVLPITFLSHTSFLHSYLNFSCEVLRFADREFYSDWWTCTSFSTFYRKWNILVHDWLHSYIYRDIKHVTGRQWMAVFATIHLSAVIHEYIVAIALQFAFPLLFLEFAIGGAMVYFLRPKSMERLYNILLLIGFCFGGANLLFFYQMEFAARIYCPRQRSLQNFFLPQLLDCYQHMNNNITSNF
ncbi:sterol O-acyltransferase 1-like [Halichondria panicea]|uniref:sterol O-acyltransferase 1-like n=1 Tax=Halichondria panicea TaxID=6063 RepID=UPI00312B3449